jgi:GT2 family glycosyltransferase
LSQTVTLGVPVLRGQEFVAESLRSIQGQTHTDLRVLISVDGPDEASEAACRPFLDDERFSLVVQPENRGWVANISWLMEQADSPLWCYQQQDDVLEPGYLEALVAEARRSPGAAVVYSDIQAFGEESVVMSQPSLTGTPFARQLLMLAERDTAVEFRGLTRTEALRGIGPVPSNSADFFSVELAWVAAAARFGELRRVPEALYRKRFHGGGVHSGWWAWPDERRERAWVVHCADMLDQAMAIDTGTDQRRLLWVVAAGRAVSNRLYGPFLPESARTEDGRRRRLGAFLDHVRGERSLDLPALLGARWRTIIRWARDLSLVAP